jgi:hypothetical protein
MPLLAHCNLFKKDPCTMAVSGWIDRYRREVGRRMHRLGDIIIIIIIIISGVGLSP